MIIVNYDFFTIYSLYCPPTHSKTHTNTYTFETGLHVRDKLALDPDKRPFALKVELLYSYIFFRWSVQSIENIKNIPGFTTCSPALPHGGGPLIVGSFQALISTGSLWRLAGWAPSAIPILVVLSSRMMLIQVEQL